MRTKYDTLERLFLTPFFFAPSQIADCYFFFARMHRFSVLKTGQYQYRTCATRVPLQLRFLPVLSVSNRRFCCNKSQAPEKPPHTRTPLPATQSPEKNPNSSSNSQKTDFLDYAAKGVVITSGVCVLLAGIAMCFEIHPAVGTWFCVFGASLAYIIFKG